MVETLQPAPSPTHHHPEWSKSRLLRFAQPKDPDALGTGYVPRTFLPRPSILEPRTSSLEPGFTLLELLIVMMIIATLAAMAIPAYTRNVLAAKEAVLHEDLQVMRTAINSYTVDKQKAPQTLQDLVSSGYLREMPKDPITGRADTWVPHETEMLYTADQTESGIDDVHSGAQQSAIDGTAYNTW